jgi:hypothetical protein
MGKLVNEQDARTTCEGRIEIELVAYDAPVFDSQCRESLEALEQTLRFDATVRLDVADHYIRICRGASTVRGFEHPVRLAYAGGSSKENAQPPALGAGFFGLNVSEKLIRIRPVIVHPMRCAQILMRCAQLLRGIAQSATPEE